ncbi:MAG: ABC transporter permease subunit, partial [Eubacteriales bacterium]
MTDTNIIIGRLIEGFGLNVQLFFVTLLFSLPLGLVIAFGSMSRFKPLSWLTAGIVWVIRGPPLMLQVLVIYFAPGLLGWG